MLFAAAAAVAYSGRGLAEDHAGHDHGHSHDGSAKKKDDDKKDEKGFRLDAGGGSSKAFRFS